MLNPFNCAFEQRHSVVASFCAFPATLRHSVTIFAHVFVSTSQTKVNLAMDVVLVGAIFEQK